MFFKLKKWGPFYYVKFQSFFFFFHRKLIKISEAWGGEVSCSECGFPDTQSVVCCIKQYYFKGVFKKGSIWPPPRAFTPALPTHLIQTPPPLCTYLQWSPWLAGQERVGVALGNPIHSLASEGSGRDGEMLPTWGRWEARQAEILQLLLPSLPQCSRRQGWASLGIQWCSTSHVTWGACLLLALSSHPHPRPATPGSPSLA